MKVFKFKERKEINKSIGKIRIKTFHYVLFGNDKHTEYSELHIWYDNDCEHCPCGWEDRGYEGECNAWGCFLAKKSHEIAPTWKCMLPNWIKGLIARRYEE